MSCHHFAQWNVRLWPKAAVTGSRSARQLSRDKLPYVIRLRRDIGGRKL
jgi:hypothetical protein